jgi:hypothetical protein
MAAYSGEVLRNLIRRALPMSSLSAKLKSRVRPYDQSLREVAEEFEAEWSPEDALTFRPRYNAAPSETLWILRHGADRRVIAPAVWGKTRPSPHPGGKC